MRVAGWIGRHAGAVWFLALAVVVAGPLLGPGRLLLLDFPSGPRFPAFPDPFEPRADVTNTEPIVALHALAGLVHPLLADKLFLLAPVFLGGLGVYRLARRGLALGVLPAIYGGTVFAVNPFVADRYLSGHLYFVLGYSLLPWAVGAALAAARRPRSRAGLAPGLWLAALAAVSLHVAGMYVLLTGTLVLLARAPLRARLACLGGAALLGSLLSSFWLLPASYVEAGPPGEVELQAYAVRPAGLPALPTLAAMYGFWRDELQRPVDAHPLLYLFLVPIVGLAVGGAAASLGSGRHRRLAGALCCAAVLGLVLAATTAFEDGRSAVRWAAELVPAVSVYREPQKLVALTVLAYAVLGAIGLEVLARRRTGVRLASLGAGLLATAAVLVYGYSMLWGLSGQVRLAHYPASWSDADELIASGESGRLLVLPGHPYAVWSFTGGRIVANPAPSFFSRDTLRRAGSGFEPPQREWREVERGLAQARSTHRLGELLAPLDVRLVAWLREADWWRYRLLEEQADLRPIYRGDGISVFENDAWRPGAELESPSAPRVAALVGHAVSLLTLIACLFLLRARRKHDEPRLAAAPRRPVNPGAAP